MICDDVLVLIGETPEAHGVFDKPTETRTTVFCRVQSVSRSEYWKAKANGVEPEFVFVLSDHLDYNGEKICEFRETRYRIVRSYVTQNEIELTVEEATVDA